MTTYYRDSSVQITSDVIRVAGQVYPLRRLDRVWFHRGAPRLRALAGRGALGAAIVGPLVAAVIGVVVALRMHATTPVTVAVVGVSALVGLAAGPLADLLLQSMDRSYDRGTRDLQIWAAVRGQPVLLLHTRDALRFGQVYRALQRAVENSSPALGDRAARPTARVAAGRGGLTARSVRDRPLTPEP